MIAGGYCSIQYFNKKLEDFPKSDIDIFIINCDGTDSIETFIMFVEYLKILGLYKLKDH